MQNVFNIIDKGTSQRKLKNIFGVVSPGPGGPMSPGPGSSN